MSLQSLLNIARSALAAEQNAMAVTSHNVANANTPGYTRQQLVLQAATPEQTPLFPLGRGVDAVAITRTRDTFYDASYRQNNGLLGQSTTMNDYLSQVESSMNEPSSTGIASSIGNLFNSFSDLASDPASKTNRDLVVSAANRLTGQIHALDAQLSTVRQETFDNMNTQVANVNTITAQIADLNSKIQATGGPSHSAPDLMDQRDNLVDQLSQIMNVRVIDHGDGSIGVVAGDSVIVDGGNTTTLAVATVGAGYGIVPAVGGAAIDPQSGSLKALADLSQTKLPNIENQLNSLAGALVTTFNAIHRTGTTLGGATNVDFFDPAGTTASTISLSSLVSASSDNIAASGTGGAGDGSVAAQIAALNSTNVASLGNQSFGEYYTGLAASVGIDVSNSSQDSQVQQSLVDQATQGRESAGGVNVDDEMVNLIAEQQAYQAAARIVSTADAMIQDIMQIT